MARLRIYLYTSVLIFMHTLVAPLGRLFSLDLSSLLSVHRPPPLLHVKHKSPPPRDRNTEQLLFFAAILDLRTVSLTKAIITEKKKKKKKKKR